MRVSLAFSALLAAAIASPTAGPAPAADGTYHLEAAGIRAQFIPYGASLRNLFVKDKNGTERDIVLGYDNISYYPVDPGHPVYNAVPGRYANRIGGGTFTLDNVTYHLEKNDGNNTLHSGTNNWSYRFWNVSMVTKDSITFSMDDPANSTGMPGRVLANVTYTLQPNAWNIKMRAISPDVRTIILLTQHTYFNLDAFANPSTDQIWNHTLHLPYSQRYLEPEPDMLPDGNIVNALPNSINDFWSQPKQLGFAMNRPEFKGNCGTGSGCAGYNNLWIVDNNSTSNVIATLASPWSGIKAQLRSNQQGAVIYTCYWMDGTAPIKSTQGHPGGSPNVTSSGCVAIEGQDWVDGINHPEWGRMSKQVYGPGDVFELESTWSFSADA